MGNVGFVGLIATVLATFIAEGSGLSIWARVSILLAVVTLLWLIGISKWLDRQLSRAITWALRRWTKLDARDFVNLLHTGEGYWVTELMIRVDGWLKEKRLEELYLTDIGVLVLGIERKNGTFIGSPTGRCRIQGGDKLLVYGSQQDLSSFEKVRSDPDGEAKHHKYAHARRRDNSHRTNKSTPI